MEKSSLHKKSAHDNLSTEEIVDIKKFYSETSEKPRRFSTAEELIKDLNS